MNSARVPADCLHDPEQELEIVLFFISASFSVFRGQTLLSNLFGSGFARLGKRTTDLGSPTSIRRRSSDLATSKLWILTKDAKNLIFR